MGTAGTFDTGFNEDSNRQLLPVLLQFFDGGGALIDTSPMYGYAEKMLGMLLDEIPADQKAQLFAATKVWTEGEQEGIKQMEHSAKLLGVKQLDLIQIHNLLDWQTQVKTLKQWREEGKVRYMGITTSHNRAHEELEKALNTEPFDFVQFSYNIANRVAEEKLLPLAQDKGIAVIINRPFQKGELFAKVKGKPLPDWAVDIQCESWAQFFLKFIVSHPAVTCTIPATDDVNHMDDNMKAGFGDLPDPEMRQRMIALYESF
jgi:diketogulonate reductase-like aldo/keto reductase